MGSDFSCLKLFNKIALALAASALLGSCGATSPQNSVNETKSTNSETLTSLTSSSTQQEGFLEAEKKLMNETLAGVALPYFVAPSYTLKAETVSSIKGITYEFTSDYYLSLKESSFSVFKAADFALIVTEIDDSDPYYIARKTLGTEVHVDVNFLVEENHFKAFAYLYDNSANVFSAFPNAALEKDLGYTLPEFAAKRYIVSYGLTSDYRYNQVDIKAEEIAMDLATYQGLLVQAGYGDFSVQSDYLMASKGPIRLLVYLEGTSALIRTSTTEKPAA